MCYSKLLGDYASFNFNTMAAVSLLGDSDKGEDCESSDTLRSSAILPWDRFSSWCHCVCIVTFDLELGQAIEVIYPGHVKLSEQEKSNICYLAFPDSNSGCMGDTQFHVRIRQAPGHRGLLLEHRLYNQKCPPYLQADPGHYCGYVYFRQSVVLISRFPFVNLFTEVCALIAPEYFENGEPSIEAACHDIDQWPAPVPGELVNLPLLGTVIQAYIPSQNNKVGVSSPTSPLKVNTSLTPTIIPSVHEINIFRCFYPILSHIHMLWELVLTAEPIVVMASSPSICSEMVQALVSMIHPLSFCADYRPFFTIHDSEFKEYTTKSHAPPPVILGVTNPFFAKTLQHWPHIIRNLKLWVRGKQEVEVVDMILRIRHKLEQSESEDVPLNKSTRQQLKLRMDDIICTLPEDLKTGVQTKRPFEVQTALLRRHLLELTQSFMIPLERYMASLMPLQKNISPYKAAPTPRPFNPDDFIATLGTSGPQLTSGTKGDWVGLYRRFFRSANFSGWFNTRYREVSQKLQILQLEALSDAVSICHKDEHTKISHLS
ncbi:hypothetical protein J437_LFUL004031 [Ladona fulva]|uniref:UDENN domain-containing protein n=1 Tax=Ladona fulva TaxID=123851 RepID=A0A8K0NUI5_LADFU|nr:hypothetical protein J437_LFUL004031 [Ladona fulva]